MAGQNRITERGERGDEKRKELLLYLKDEEAVLWYLSLNLCYPRYRWTILHPGNCKLSPDQKARNK